MARTPVTAQAFADQLQAAGVRIIWRDDTEFEARHGKGNSARSATVTFFRDTCTFSHARSGGGNPLRSMRSVFRHLRLTSGKLDPARKAGPDLACDLSRSGAIIVWLDDTFLNFDATLHERTVHVHCHSADKTFNYARGGGCVFESMAAVKQYLGIRRTPASLFAAGLERAGATVRWRDSHEFQAEYHDGTTRRIVIVVYNPVNGRLRYGSGATGMPLRTKDDIRVYLRLPQTV